MWSGLTNCTATENVSVLCWAVAAYQTQEVEARGLEVQSHPGLHKKLRERQVDSQGYREMVLKNKKQKSKKDNLSTLKND